MLKHFVFVYGTLRRGEGNSRLFGKTSMCLGPACTGGAGYKMSRHKDSTVPYVADGGTHQVLGELWFVDDATFKRLDRLEGHPNFYRRRRRWFRPVHPSKLLDQAIRGWIYLCDNATAEPVKPNAQGWLRAPTTLEINAKAEF